jgi:hypothetical protein
MIGLGVWGVSEATGGLPQRFTPEVGRLSAYVADRPALMPDCEVVPSAPDLRDACVVGVKNRQPSWIIVGDSHAWALHPALQRWMTQNNVAAVFVFNHGCPPLFGVHLIGDFRDGCYVFQQKVQALGLAHPELRSVLLISTWLQASEGALGDSPRAKPEDSLAVFARQFPVTMQWWHGQRRQVHVWGPLPGARRAVPPSMAMAARWGADSQSPLAWRRADYDARYAFFHTALSGSQQWVSRSIDPASRVCGPQPQDECLYALDGVPLYYDTNHPSRSSASVWADLLVHSVPHTGS